MKLEDIHQSKVVREIIVIIAVVISVLFVLLIGINIGERRARFAGEFGNNFERNFIGPRGGIMGGFFNQRLPGGHGAIGKIISINLPQMIISGPDNLEKTILVSTSTLIRRFRENIQSAELKVGDFVVAIGDPNNKGQIEAKLIRIMPQ
jgi:hypothetical protein